MPEVREFLFMKEFGAYTERERIIALMNPHLEKCNYFAVYNEPCDVCCWIEDTVADIRGIPRPVRKLKPVISCGNCRNELKESDVECEHPNLTHADSSAHLAYCPDCDFEMKCECTEKRNGDTND